MTGFVSKRQAAQGKLDDDDDTQVYADRKRGSIALARELCVQIAGYTDDDQDQCGHDYGSVDIAEILSAEVVRLQKALAQPEQEPVAYDYHTKYDRGCYKCRSQFCPGNCIYTTPPLPVQEPVAWMSSDRAWMWSDYSKALAAVAHIPRLTLIPLYTTPPQKEKNR